MRSQCLTFFVGAGVVFLDLGLVFSAESPSNVMVLVRGIDGLLVAWAAASDTARNSASSASPSSSSGSRSRMRTDDDDDDEQQDEDDNMFETVASPTRSSEFAAQPGKIACSCGNLVVHVLLCHDCLLSFQINTHLPSARVRLRTVGRARHRRIVAQGIGRARLCMHSTRYKFEPNCRGHGSGCASSNHLLAPARHSRRCDIWRISAHDLPLCC